MSQNMQSVAKLEIFKMHGKIWENIHVDFAHLKWLLTYSKLITETSSEANTLKQHFSRCSDWNSFGSIS